ncbi:hypothetical protein BKA80DRAFT_24516 [Phyllosticta citrichinensis]
MLASRRRRRPRARAAASCSVGRWGYDFSTWMGMEKMTMTFGTNCSSTRPKRTAHENDMPACLPHPTRRARLLSQPDHQQRKRGREGGKCSSTEGFQKDKGKKLARGGENTG